MLQVGGAAGSLRGGATSNNGPSGLEGFRRSKAFPHVGCRPVCRGTSDRR